MWGCQHFQARDNRALFPCHIGKIINIPRVCFQAALWNKSQTVVVSLGSLILQNCLFSLHESPTPALPLTAPPRPCAVAAPCWMCRGHPEQSCPCHPALCSWVLLPGSGVWQHNMLQIVKVRGLSRGTRALLVETSIVLETGLFHPLCLRWKEI